MRHAGGSADPSDRVRVSRKAPGSVRHTRADRVRVSGRTQEGT